MKRLFLLLPLAYRQWCQLLLWDAWQSDEAILDVDQVLTDGLILETGGDL
jgi:hypothetical protein